MRGVTIAGMSGRTTPDRYSTEDEAPEEASRDLGDELAEHDRPQERAERESREDQRVSGGSDDVRPIDLGHLREAGFRPIVERPMPRRDPLPEHGVDQRIEARGHPEGDRRSNGDLARVQD